MLILSSMELLLLASQPLYHYSRYTTRSPHRSIRVMCHG